MVTARTWPAPWPRSTTPRAWSAWHREMSQVGGRVIVTLRSQQPGGALRAPGSPAVSPAELRDLDGQLNARGLVRNTRRLELIGAVVGTVNENQLDSLLASPLVEMVEADVLIPMQDNGPTVPLSLQAQRQSVRI